MTDREKALDKARLLLQVIGYESADAGDEGVQNERKSAQARLDELVEKWGFTDAELHPPEELEDDMPPGMTFDELLDRLGITKEQISGFLGKLAFEGLNACVTKLCTGKWR